MLLQLMRKLTARVDFISSSSRRHATLHCSNSLQSNIAAATSEPRRKRARAVRVPLTGAPAGARARRARRAEVARGAVVVALTGFHAKDGAVAEVVEAVNVAVAVAVTAAAPGACHPELAIGVAFWWFCQHYMRGTWISKTVQTAT
jgi:hypothetical protein